MSNEVLSAEEAAVLAAAACGCGCAGAHVGAPAGESVCECAEAGEAERAAGCAEAGVAEASAAEAGAQVSEEPTACACGCAGEGAQANPVRDDASASRDDANREFLKASAQTERRIKRHSLQARLTHGFTAICCILLTLSGLFVFVPALNALVGANMVFVFRMGHRVLGVAFILVPLISAITAPRGVKHIGKNLFAKWNSDDKKWMMLFMPYLFLAKHLHMPDQDEVKSGQRFADGVIWFACGVMALSGAAMLLGSTVLDIGAAYGVWLLIHDLGFFLIAVFGMAHIFLGAGIFQPYRGMAWVMWGSGTVSESDALYHWGHWARQELTSGKNVIEK